MADIEEEMGSGYRAPGPGKAAARAMRMQCVAAAAAAVQRGAPAEEIEALAARLEDYVRRGPGKPPRQS